MTEVMEIVAEFAHVEDALDFACLKLERTGHSYVVTAGDHLLYAVRRARAAASDFIPEYLRPVPSGLVRQAS